MNDRLVIPVVFDTQTGQLKTAEGDVVRVGKAADTAKSKVGGLGGVFRNLVAPLLGFAAALAAIRKGLALVAESIKLAGIQAIADNKLAQAILNTGAAVEEWKPRLDAAANALQAVSNYGNEMVQTAQAMLLSFAEAAGPRGVEFLTSRLGDMAAGVTKTSGAVVDLNQMAALMGRALTTGASALKRVGISLTEAQEAAFNAATGMDKVRLLGEIIDSNFKGMAEAIADPFVQLDNAAGDLKEVLGMELRGALSDVAKEIQRLAQDEGVIELVRRLGGVLADAVQQVGPFLDVIQDAVDLAGAVGDLGAAIGEVGEAFGVSAGNAEYLRRQIKATQEEMEALAEATSWVATQIDEEKEAYRRLFVRLGLVEDGMSKAAAAANDVKLDPVVDEFNRVSNAAEGAEDAATAALENLMARIDAFRARYLVSLGQMFYGAGAVMPDFDTPTLPDLPDVTGSVGGSSGEGADTTARDNERRVEEARDLANRLIDLGEVVKEARRNAADAATLHAIRMSRERLAQLQVEAETEARLIRDAEERERTLAGVRHAYRMQSIALDRRQAEAEEAIAVAASERERDRALVEARRLDTARERAAAVEVAEAEHQTRLTEILRDGEHARAEIATASAEAQAAFAAESSDEVERIYQEAADRANAALQDMEPPPLPIEAWESQLRGGALDSVNQIDTALRALDTAFSDAAGDEQRARIGALIDKLGELREAMVEASRSAPAIGETLAHAAAIGSDALGALASFAQTAYQAQAQAARDSGQEQTAAGRAAFETYKALAVTQAVIDTFASAQAAYRAMAGIPVVGPGLGAAAASAAVLAGLANVARIRSASAGGSTSRGASAGGGASTSRPASGVAAGLALGYGQGSGYGGSRQASAAPVNHISVAPAQMPDFTLTIDGVPVAKAVNRTNASEARRRGTGGGLG
ncbi:MAG: hypothetical protein CMM84_16105 [Rhodothermaceae bacterium]|nr:hypothetical protein [Rhodothermaceae bacterium]MBC12532.1 hypothetical protein [Rhodothermaceae bacterium]